MATRDGLTGTVPLWRIALARTLAACGLFARFGSPPPLQLSSSQADHMKRGAERGAPLDVPNYLILISWGNNKPCMHDGVIMISCHDRVPYPNVRLGMNELRPDAQYQVQII